MRVFCYAMNRLASDLNTTLDGSVAGRLLSKLGREFYFPKGIVAQTAEANARAHRYNATVGMAFEKRKPMILSSLASLIPSLDSVEMVSYAPTPGVVELRTRWQKEITRKNPSLGNVATTLPMVTSGLTNGLFQIAELFADEGDTLVLPELFWGNYRLIYEVRRGVQFAMFPFFDKTGGFNVAGLTKALPATSKAIVLLNFPNNPTGYSPTVDEAARIVDTLVQFADDGHDLLVVSDDAYFGLFYEDDVFTESLFAPLATAHERILAVKVDGATKEEFAWGFRVGFVTFAGKGLNKNQLDGLEHKLMGSIRATVSNSSRPAQSLLLRMLDSPTYVEEKAAKRAILKERYRAVKTLLTDLDLGPLTPLPFNSGYFMSFDCGQVDAEKLRLALLEKGIGTIAIGNRHLRVAFSTVDKEDLRELYCEIIETAGECL